jgi:hypothetical protein
VSAAVIPGAVTWYGDSPPKQFWDANAFRQAREASAYISRLPHGRPVVFLVGAAGFFGPISVPEEERTIRAGLSPAQQPRVHFYPGDAENLFAGRPTLLDDTEINRANRPYWLDVHRVLERHPAVLVCTAFAPYSLHAGHGPTGRVVGPGLRVLRGPAMRVAQPRGLHPVPSTATAVARAAVIVLLLLAAGLGWTLWFLGRDRSAVSVLALSPAVGAGMLMLGSLALVKAGFVLGGGAGVAEWAIVGATGALLALLSGLRKPREEVADG